MDIQNMCDQFKNSEEWTGIMNTGRERLTRSYDSAKQRLLEQMQTAEATFTKKMTEINMCLCGLMITRDQAEDESVKAALQKTIDEKEKQLNEMRKDLEEMKKHMKKVHTMISVIDMNDRIEERLSGVDDDTPLRAPWAVETDSIDPIPLLRDIADMYSDEEENNELSEKGELILRLIRATLAAAEENDDEDGDNNEAEEI